MHSETDYAEHHHGSYVEMCWYENDLQLAAELGKTLLERNRELENQLRQAQQCYNEKARDVELVNKQMDVMRHVSESRMRIYEEVDRNLHDLEKNSERWRHEAKADKERMKSLVDTVDSLETRCDELRTKLLELRDKERMRQKRDKRTWSVPSLTEVSDLENFKGFKEGFDYLGYPSVFDGHSPKKSTEKGHIKQLKDTVRNLKLASNVEQCKREELEADNSHLEQEKKAVVKKLQRLEKEHQELLESQLVDAFEESSNTKLCANCAAKKVMETSDRPDLIEHDDITEITHGEVVRLKNGGSAYGSRESLNLIGLELDTSPAVETCGEILASHHLTADTQTSCENLAQLASLKSPDSSVSLLGELEEQYRKLVLKYERMVEERNKRSAAKDAQSTQDSLEAGTRRETATGPGTAAVKHRGVVMRPKVLPVNEDSQTTWRKSACLDFTSPVDPTDGHFEKGPPEYKRLFKEIFETLKRSSAVYEDDFDVIANNEKSAKTAEK